MNKGLVYWRRSCFPARNISDVEVDISFHDKWNKIYCDLSDPEGDINDSLGLSGDLTCPALITDASTIRAAIIAKLGIEPSPPDDILYDCPWDPENLDGNIEDYEQLQVHCSLLYEELRLELKNNHGINIVQLKENKMGLDAWAFCIKNENKEEISYWRKQWSLQDFMEEIWINKKKNPKNIKEFAETLVDDDDTFNCVDLQLDYDILNSIEDHFHIFDEEYKKENINFLNKAKECLDNGFEVYYTSWW